MSSDPDRPPSAAVPPAIFDQTLLGQRLARAARRGPADFLLARTVEDLMERLAAVKRAFVGWADIGTPTPALSAALAAAMPAASGHWLGPMAAALPGVTARPGALEHLDLADGSLDLAVSALALQTVNDLPGTLIQIRRALKPDGLFLAALLGGRTLTELRSALGEAELELLGGASPRVAPFADVRDMGALLQRAGFALPVADSDVVTVRYPHLFALMADLRAMGGTNMLVARSRRPSSRRLFVRAAEIYAARFADPDGRIRASFEIVSLSGWAPHESQQKPARRGSGQVSLTRVLGRDGSGDV